jgi:hypothetical protein
MSTDAPQQGAAVISALTPKQVAEHYGVSVHTVLHWINGTGELKAINCGRSPGKKKPRWKILPEQLANFDLGRESNPTPAPRTRRRRQAVPAGTIEFYK